MLTLGNICGGLFVLVVLAMLYFAMAFLLGLVAPDEVGPIPKNPALFDRLIYWLRGQPRQVRWFVLVLTPLLLVVFGVLLYIAALADVTTRIVKRFTSRGVKSTA